MRQSLTVSRAYGVVAIAALAVACTSGRREQALGTSAPPPPGSASPVTTASAGDPARDAAPATTPGLKVELTGAKRTCPGTCQELAVQVSGGSGAYQFDWNEGLSGPGPQRVCPHSPVTYTVMVTDQAAGSQRAESARFAIEPDGAQCDHARELCAFRVPLDAGGGEWSDSANNIFAGFTPEDLGAFVHAASDGTLAFALGVNGARLPEQDGDAPHVFDSVLVGKLDAQCQLLWSLRIRDSVGLWPLGLATDSRGDVFLTGNALGRSDVGGLVSDAAGGMLLMARIDAAGTPQWVQRFGEAYNGDERTYPEDTARVAVGPADELVVYGDAWGDRGLGSAETTGLQRGQCAQGGPSDERDHCGYAMNIDLASGETRSVQRFPAIAFVSSIAIAEGGGMIFSATQELRWADGTRDEGAHLLAKLDSATERVWSSVVAPTDGRSRFAGFDWHWDRALKLDPAGNVLYLAKDQDDPEPNVVRFDSDPTPWTIAKFDVDGRRLWAEDVARSHAGTPAAMVATPGGETVVVGHFAGVADFGASVLQADGDRDAFVLALDADGNAAWAARYGSPDAEWASDAASDADGNVWLSGFRGQWNSGSRAVQRQEAFIAKLAP